jgi:ribonuclease P protein component
MPAPDLTLREESNDNPPPRNRIDVTPRPSRGRHEADFSTEQPPPPQDPRVSRADEHQERPAGSETSAREGTTTPHGVTGGQRFRPKDRIRKRREYQAVYDKGQRIPSGSFVLFVMRNSSGGPRLGITVTKRIGGAVRRNRAKRLVREVFRRHRTELMDVDIVVNGRSVLPRADFRRLEAEFMARLRPFLRTAR